MFDATPEEYVSALAAIYAKSKRARIDADPFSAEQLARLRILRDLAGTYGSADRADGPQVRLVSALHARASRIDG